MNISDLGRITSKLCAVYKTPLIWTTTSLLLAIYPAASWAQFEGGIGGVGGIGAGLNISSSMSVQATLRHLGLGFAPSFSCEPVGPDEIQSFSNWAGLAVTTETYPKYMTPEPEVALLKRGFWERMDMTLARKRISTLFVTEKFDPGELYDRAPVLVIPTGALSELGGDGPLRQSLAAYVNLGGGLVVMTQAHAAEYELLPGGAQ